MSKPADAQVRRKSHAPGESSAHWLTRERPLIRSVGSMTGLHRMLSARWLRTVGPVLPIAMFGAVWIVLHAEAGRAGTHTLFQALAMAECTVALLLRGRKPLGALASILVMYGVTGLDTLLIMPVMFAVATVA